MIFPPSYLYARLQLSFYYNRKINSKTHKWTKWNEPNRTPQRIEMKTNNNKKKKMAKKWREDEEEEAQNPKSTLYF